MYHKNPNSTGLYGRYLLLKPFVGLGLLQHKIEVFVPEEPFPGTIGGSTWIFVVFTPQEQGMILVLGANLAPILE